MTAHITEHGRKALIRVAEWLEAGTPHVDINGRQLDRFDMEYAVNSSFDCGTACCIAGAICQFEGLGSLYGGDMSFFGENGAGEIAAEFLGISEVEAEMLFCPWDHFDNEFPAEFSDATKAAVTVRRFVETGIIEWDGHDITA